MNIEQAIETEVAWDWWWQTVHVWLNAAPGRAVRLGRVELAPSERSVWQGTVELWQDDTCVANFKRIYYPRLRHIMRLARDVGGVVARHGGEEAA